MNRGFRQRETLLEVGLVALGGLLVTGLLVLLSGKLTGALKRALRRAKGVPQPGSVPPERHIHVKLVAPR